jgi:hypothetical protein
MSIKRVVVGAIGAIGAFLFLIVLISVARFERSWLPYVAEPLGALIAGGALVRQGTGHRFEALAAGVLSVAMLAAIAFTSPSTFTWVAVRSAHPWLIATILAIGCGAASHAGARAAYGRGGLLSVVVLSTAFGAGMLLFCTRIAIVFSLRAFTFDSNAVATMLCVPAFIAGYAVQSVVPLTNAGACASGVGILVLVQIVDGMSKGHMADSALFWMLVMVAAAFFGALAAQAVRSTLQASRE